MAPGRGPGRGGAARGGPAGRRLADGGVPALRHPDQLLDQVKQEALAGLRECWITEVCAVPEDGDPGDVAVARLRAAGAAYVAFATARSQDSSTRPSAGRTPTRKAPIRPAGRSARTRLFAETEAFRQLGLLLDDLVATGRMDAARREGAEVAAWSAVHGFAALAVEGPLGGTCRRRSRRPHGSHGRHGRRRAHAAVAVPSVRKDPNGQHDRDGIGTPARARPGA